MGLRNYMHFNANIINRLTHHFKSHRQHTVLQINVIINSHHSIFFFYFVNMFILTLTQNANDIASSAKQKILAHYHFSLVSLFCNFNFHCANCRQFSIYYLAISVVVGVVPINSHDNDMHLFQRIWLEPR